MRHVIGLDTVESSNADLDGKQVALTFVYIFETSVMVRFRQKLN